MEQTSVNDLPANNLFDWEVTSSTNNTKPSLEFSSVGERGGGALPAGATEVFAYLHTKSLQDEPLELLYVPRFSLHFSVRQKLLYLFFCPPLEWIHCGTEWQSVPSELESCCASDEWPLQRCCWYKGRLAIVALHSRRAETRMPCSSISLRCMRVCFSQTAIGLDGTSWFSHRLSASSCCIPLQEVE